jgi:hypothetical protein
MIKVPNCPFSCNTEPCSYFFVNIRSNALYTTQYLCRNSLCTAKNHIIVIVYNFFCIKIKIKHLDPKQNFMVHGHQNQGQSKEKLISLEKNVGKNEKMGWGLASVPLLWWRVRNPPHKVAG